MQRLFAFFAERDLAAAERARVAIAKALEFLRDFPFACRKLADESTFMRDMVVEFGQVGYVLLFEIDAACQATVLAARHQGEDDFL